NAADSSTATRARASGSGREVEAPAPYGAERGRSPGSSSGTDPRSTSPQYRSSRSRPPAPWPGRARIRPWSRCAIARMYGLAVAVALSHKGGSLGREIVTYGRDHLALARGVEEMPARYKRKVETGRCLGAPPAHPIRRGLGVTRTGEGADRYVQRCRRVEAVRAEHGEVSAQRWKKTGEEF